MNLLEELRYSNSVTETLERYYKDVIHYESICNISRAALTPNEIIALQCQDSELFGYKRYGFLRGQTGNVYARIESITLNHLLDLNMNNDIPLGKLLKPHNYTRENTYARAVQEQDEAGNDIIFKIHARLHTDRPISLVREWIYSVEKPSLDKLPDIQ